MLVGHCCQEFGDPKDIPEPSYKSIEVHGLNGVYSVCDFSSDIKTVTSLLTQHFNNNIIGSLGL